MVIDYFTKWVEAVPLSEVTGQQIVKFLWLNIVCRFGLPHTVISDNGMNFASKQVISFCASSIRSHIDPFLKLYRDEGIDRHFTVRKTLQ